MSHLQNSESFIDLRQKLITNKKKEVLMDARAIVIIEKLRTLIDKLDGIESATDASDAIMIPIARLKSCLSELLASKNLATDLPKKFEELQKLETTDDVTTVIQGVQNELNILASSPDTTGSISEIVEELETALKEIKEEAEELRKTSEGFQHLGDWLGSYIATLPDVELRAVIANVAKLIGRDETPEEIQHIIEARVTVI